jgi:hypothetical protein
VIGSRRQRWNTLARFVGLDSAPTHFRAYRGTDRQADVISVVESWIEGKPYFRIPHLGLSSWSLLERGARHYFDQYRYGVLVQITVSISNTLMDILVDDGYFARHGCKEAELVVGTGNASDVLDANLADVRVRIAGQEYGYQERASAEASLRSRHLLTD